MHERGDASPVSLHVHDRAPLALPGKLHRPTGSVDVALVLGEPVRELERRVAERPGERLPQPAGRRRAGELEHEPRDRGAREPAVEETDEKRDRYEDEGGVRGEPRLGHERVRARRTCREEDDGADRGEPARPHDRRHRSASRRRGRAPAAGEDDDDGYRDDEADDVDRLEEPVGGAARRDEEDVLRKFRRGRVEQDADDLQQGSEAVRDPDRDPLRQRAQEALREREHEVDEEAQRKDRSHQPDAEENAHVGPLQRRQEPAGACSDHEQSDAVVRAADPGDDAARDEGPDDERVENGDGRRHSRVRRVDGEDEQQGAGRNAGQADPERGASHAAY